MCCLWSSDYSSHDMMLALRERDLWEARTALHCFPIEHPI